MNALQKAEEIIYGDREKTYGHPAINLNRIARYWQTYLESRVTDPFSAGAPLTAQDVAQMMILVKIARLNNQPDHEDSIVDICGYAALIERCHEAQKAIDDMDIL
jgi:hypothetical protein